MQLERMQIGNIPAILLGEPSDKLYLFIHGQCGNKEEAEAFGQLVCPKGWQVLGIDLPEHGERSHLTNTFDPWHVVPELRHVLAYANQKWGKIALRANSIGAWFSMLSFAEDPLERCLFVSPILDMSQLIQRMMQWANVTEAQLKQEQNIPTNFGQTLSWYYLVYARENPILSWKHPTDILYGDQDSMTERRVVEAFTRQFGCDLTVVENGEHWFHTPQQLKILDTWINHHV